MIPTDDLLPRLQQDVRRALFRATVIPKAAYPRDDADVPVVGVANLLVVDEAMAEQLAYDITRLLFEKQAELAAIHPEARTCRSSAPSSGSPAPFHPGAIRFYREQACGSRSGRAANGPRMRVAGRMCRAALRPVAVRAALVGSTRSTGSSASSSRRSIASASC